MPSCEITLRHAKLFYSRQLEQDTIQQQRDIAAERLQMENCANSNENKKPFRKMNLDF